MNYLSTNEVATLWGVSRKTVTRYASEGKIPGAMLVGRTWMIPEDAKTDCLDASNGEEKPDQANDFRFPMYICLDFFNLKDSLNSQEELKLYSAFEYLMADDFREASLIAQQLYSEAEDVPIRVTCLYVMCRCCIYLRKYPLFMEHAYEMGRIFEEDFPHKKEMEFLLIDIDSYYKGLNSLFNFSFDSSYEYSRDVYPAITTVSLYQQMLMSIKERFDIDLTVYELALKELEGNGCVYHSILLSSYLALAYHNKRQDQVAYLYTKKAFELAERYHGYFMLTDIYTVHPKLVRKALKHYDLTMSEGLKRHLKNFRQSYIGLMAYLKVSKPIVSYSTDDYDYIFYAISGYTNKEIAAEKQISESAVSKRYEKLCRSYSVESKKELAGVFLATLENYGNN